MCNSKFKIQNSKFSRSGAMFLITILVIGAVALIIAVAIVINSLGEMQAGFLKSQSQQTFAAAEACLEESILHLIRDQNYTGGTINFGSAVCSISIQHETNYIININAQYKNYTKKIRVEFNFAEKRIVSYEELKD